MNGRDWNPFYSYAIGCAGLERQAEDPYPLNRTTLLSNPSLPIATIVELMSDPEPQVRFTAATRLAKQARIAALSGSPIGRST
ncbi:hypothetical protein GCM10023174_19880 [Chelativorans composti]